MNVSQFREWHSLQSLSLMDIPESQWELSFVYLVRQRSSKDLLYIGSTTNLILRMFGNYIAGAGASTTQRIQSLLLDDGFIKDTEVNWLESSDCRTEEKRLLEAYLKEHGKLPPWNKRL